MSIFMSNARTYALYDGRGVVTCSSGVWRRAVIVCSWMHTEGTRGGCGHTEGTDDITHLRDRCRSPAGNMDGAAGCVAAHRKQFENARRRAQDVATRVEIGSDWGGPGHVTCYGKMLPGPLYDACMC